MGVKLVRDGEFEMTFDEFNKFQLTLIDEVIRMRDTKGKEYANSTDRFANFKRLAEQLEISNIQIAWIYTTKHLDAIAQYCRTQETRSTEPIRGRIVDAITYLTLIAGMIKEWDPLPIAELKDQNQGSHQPFEYDPTRGRK